MANVSDHRVKQGPGSEARDEPHPRPVTDALLSAIEASGLNPHALERASGVRDSTSRSFIAREGDPSLEAVDKLAVVVGVRLVCESRCPEPGDDDDPTRPISTVLRSAIAAAEASGLSFYAQGKATGVNPHSIRRFVGREADLSLKAVDKLVVFHGLKAVREVRHPGPPASDDLALRPVREALILAFNDSGQTVYVLNKATGLHQSALRRFFRRESDQELKTIDKIAMMLGVRVVPIGHRPGPGDGDDDPTRPISTVLRSAIEASGLKTYALSVAIGVDEETIRGFMRGEHDIRLLTAEKFLNPLRLKVIREDKAWRPEPNPPIINPLLQYLLDKLPAAIEASGLSRTALAKKSGVTLPSICRFLNGKGGLQLATAIKLANAVGLNWSPASLQTRSVEVSTPAGVSSAPTPERRCPVELQGEGLPIRVHEGDRVVETPKLGGVAYAVLKLIVDRCSKGGGCTPGELRALTGADRAMALFGQALKREGFEPLKRMIPAWNAGRNKVVEIVDAGPRD